MIRALTFADILAEERARIMREGGWTDAARLGALCARTRDPKWCTQAKDAAVGAAKGTVKAVKQKASDLAKAVKHPFTAAATSDAERAEQTAARQRAEDQRNELFNARKRALEERPGGYKGVQRKVPTPEEGRRIEIEHAAALQKDLEGEDSPRFLTGPKKGKLRKRHEYGKGTSIATFGTRWAGN